MKATLVKPQTSEIVVSLSVKEAEKLYHFLGCTSHRNVKELMQKESVSVVTEATASEVDDVLCNLYENIGDRLDENAGVTDDIRINHGH